MLVSTRCRPEKRGNKCIGKPLLLFALSVASASAEARHQHDVSMTEEECADCVLSDEETALLRELYVVHTSREQRIMLCAPMFDHVFGDFDTPRGYERLFAMARGFVSDERPASHISNPGYYRFKLRYKYGKSKEHGMHIDLP